jgi:hypothetical protein
MHFEEQKHNFTFRFDSDDGERTLEMNCNELFLGDILDRFKEFMQGCGYVIDGQLEVTPSWDDFDHKTDDTKFDFSNIPNNNWPFGEKKNDEVCLPVVPTSDK